MSQTLSVDKLSMVYNAVDEETLIYQNINVDFKHMPELIAEISRKLWFKLLFRKKKIFTVVEKYQTLFEI